MFNVFNDDNKPKNNTPSKSEISEKVFNIVATNEFILGTIKAVQTLLGEEVVKKLEAEISNEVVTDLNNRETQGEAFLVAVFRLMHYASALEGLENNYLEWRDK